MYFNYQQLFSETVQYLVDDLYVQIEIWGSLKIKKCDLKFSLVNWFHCFSSWAWSEVAFSLPLSFSVVGLIKPWFLWKHPWDFGKMLTILLYFPKDHSSHDLGALVFLIALLVLVERALDLVHTTVLTIIPISTLDVHGIRAGDFYHIVSCVALHWFLYKPQFRGLLFLPFATGSTRLQYFGLTDKWLNFAIFFKNITRISNYSFPSALRCLYMLHCKTCWWH